MTTAAALNIYSFILVWILCRQKGELGFFKFQFVLVMNGNSHIFVDCFRLPHHHEMAKLSSCQVNSFHFWTFIRFLLVLLIVFSLAKALSIFYWLKYQLDYLRKSFHFCFPIPNAVCSCQIFVRNRWWLNSSPYLFTAVCSEEQKNRFVQVVVVRTYTQHKLKIFSISYVFREMKKNEH